MDKLYSLKYDIGLSAVERSAIVEFLKKRKANVEFVKLKVDGDKLKTLHMSLSGVYKAIEIISEWIKVSLFLKYSSDSYLHKILRTLKDFVQKVEQNPQKP